MTYKSMDEWLDEIEVFSLRRERFLEEHRGIPDIIAYGWVSAAWELGRQSACGGLTGNGHVPAMFSTEQTMTTEQLERLRDKMKSAIASAIILEYVSAIDESFIADFAEWNLATFGPGLRTEGTVAHIRKELDEVLADPTDHKEWVDILILSLNGLVRLGLSPAEIIAAVKAKHEVNKSRKWPDWRDHPDTPIEHDRSGEA